MADTDVSDRGKAVLVTGAAGGAGIHIARRLSGAGWRVVAVDRAGADDARRTALLSGDEGIEWHVTSDPDTHLKSLVEKVDAVVHAAGLTRLSVSRRALFEANLEFTERLYNLARTTDIGQFVHLSCTSVYRSEQDVRTEDSPTRACNDFEESKLAAEAMLRKASADGDGPEVTILRLALLYGPGCTAMGAGMVTIPAILRRVSRYLPGLTGGPRTNWCHVDDAASAVETVLDEPQAYGKTFNVADETPLSFGEVLTAISEAYDIDLGPSVRIPSLALWALLSPVFDSEWAFERARNFLRHRWDRVQKRHDLDSPLVPRLNRDAMFYVRDDSVIVADALRDLGWKPRWANFREGIADAIRWYQNHDWAPRFERQAFIRPPDAPSDRQFDYPEQFHGHLEADEKLRFELELEVGWPAAPVPPRAREGDLRGELTIPGLARNTPVRGTVDLQWFPHLEMAYQFGFRNLEGKTCRFEGIRRFNWSSPASSLLSLEGTLVDRHGASLGDVSARRTDGPLPLLLSERTTQP